MENVEAVGAAQTVIAQADKFAKISLQIKLLLFQINLTVLVCTQCHLISVDVYNERLDDITSQWKTPCQMFG